MFRGWQVVYKDGSAVYEGQVTWKSVKKNQIQRLILHYDNRRWILEGKPAYLQRKRASMIPGRSDTIRVEKRSIGYYDGNSKVWYTVDEYTGVMNISVEDS